MMALMSFGSFVAVLVPTINKNSKEIEQQQLSSYSDNTETITTSMSIDEEQLDENYSYTDNSDFETYSYSEIRDGKTYGDLYNNQNGDEQLIIQSSS